QRLGRGLDLAHVEDLAPSSVGEGEHLHRCKANGVSDDVIVVGSGPNGLAAAITLAEAGRSVLVLEARDTPGGGMRTAELTLPGFKHDVCSAIHPMAPATPFFRDHPLGIDWLRPEVDVTHPFDDGTAASLERVGRRWRTLFDP